MNARLQVGQDCSHFYSGVMLRCPFPKASGSGKSVQTLVNWPPATPINFFSLLSPTQLWTCFGSKIRAEASARCPVNIGNLPFTQKSVFHFVFCLACMDLICTLFYKKIIMYSSLENLVYVCTYARALSKALMLCNESCKDNMSQRAGNHSALLTRKSLIP